MPYEIRGTNLAGSVKSQDAAASALNLQLDAAYHQNFQDGKLKVIYSTGIGHTSVKYTVVDNNNPAALNNSYDKNHLFVPVGVAVEHATFETLKTRFGVRKNVFSSRTTTDKTTAQTLRFQNEVRGAFGKRPRLVS